MTPFQTRGYLFFIFLLSITIFSCKNQSKIIWQIGTADGSADEFALAPDEYSRFLEKDFGWEDGFYLIGTSDEKNDWPYVLPGPSDEFGGTSGTAGWRSHTLNILFSMEKIPKNAEWTLLVDLVNYNKNNPPVFKTSINGKSWKNSLPAETGKDMPLGKNPDSAEYTIKIPFDSDLLNMGGNEISLTTLQGSWLMFDQIRLEGPAKSKLKENKQLFIRKVEPADYEIKEFDEKVQPLLVDVEHLNGLPKLEVYLDGKIILSETVETGRYVYEAPMPAVLTSVKSSYEIKVDGKTLEKGKIQREQQKTVTPADYADTKMGTAHSRWMIAPGPWMPFSMVKLSPDNQNSGWQSGYDPIFETIGGFSHIHEWTMAGLLLMPTNGPLVTIVGDEKRPDEEYRSRLNTNTEKASIAYYKAELTDYNILAELTSTTRCGFQRYTFPQDRPNSRILVDLQIPAEYRYKLKKVQIKKVSDNRVESFSSQISPNTWSGGVSQEYIVHFVLEFDQPVKSFGFWTEEGTITGSNILQQENPEDAGAWFEFDTGSNPVVQVRTGISYVSIENAAKNLETEISQPFGWDFEAEKAFEAIKKMQTTPAQKVGGGFAGNRDLLPYLQYKYVPHDKGRFSNTLEYAFDDWTVAQFAKTLGKESDYQTFMERGYYWRNAIDPESGYARMKYSAGEWLSDFDPYQSGRNHHYVEGNAWQLTFFVPQDVPALAEAIGKEQFVERLDWGFNESNKWRFNAPNDQYWDYPVMQGNQQSMHFAFLFNWVEKPWLTQKWSRAITERYYGYGLANAYLGDEDQGQMSAWFIMAALGLFQTDGGTSVEPVYEISSPLFSKVEIDLGQQYGRGEKFTIEAQNASRINKYIQSARLNGEVLNSFKFPASELLKGGKLELILGPKPNEEWGIQ
jgi:putative alpha-1,2-mannosidase